MLNKFTIPLGVILQFDDVGWDDGRDLRFWGKASRSGIPRNHALEDYQLLHEIGKGMKSKVLVALCLGDWDKDNVLRGVVGPTHDPHGWDRASEIDIDKFTQYRDTLEGSDFVEYTIHGLLHGNYDENGKQINETECFIAKKDEDGKTIKELISEECFEEHLDLFDKIYDSWGFKQPLDIFISPCGMGGSTDELIDQVTKILYKRGVRYWTNSGFPFDAPLKVYNGVVLTQQRCRIPVRFKCPWNAYDINPATFPDVMVEEKCMNGPMVALHWTNILRFDPKRNFEQVEPWVNYFKGQNEIFGFMTAEGYREAVNQLFHYWFGRASYENGKYVIDLSLVSKENFEPLKKEFFVSFKKDVEPKAIDGGEISLYDTHNDFNTYKIVYTGDLVEIFI